MVEAMINHLMNIRTMFNIYNSKSGVHFLEEFFVVADSEKKNPQKFRAARYQNFQTEEKIHNRLILNVSLT